jgi:tRNA(Ile)-lysidine synthase
VGARLDERATRLAVDFAAAAASGRRHDMGGAWTLRTELDRLALRAEFPVPRDVPLRIPDAGPGQGDALIAGESYRVVWCLEGRDAPASASARHAERFDPDALRFPLSVRAREPGDRIRLPGGTKKVKKLLLERRIPAARRARTPLVVDAEGDVLWIPEVARAEHPRGRASSGPLRIGIG